VATELRGLVSSINATGAITHFGQCQTLLELLFVITRIGAIKLSKFKKLEILKVKTGGSFGAQKVPMLVKPQSGPEMINKLMWDLLECNFYALLQI
jgi:hypothetical protein